jgi:hypothetical protein
MRYAFVCLTILVIWVAIILMALSVRHSTVVPALYYSALIMTVGLFWIGFRTR